MISPSEVTIIMPVYNTEKYLEEAVDSVLAQTISDWSLLLIDDGSSDGSGIICDRYAAHDKRIRVFHTDNRGYACARNLGLQNTVSEWVMFLDSDDVLAPHALEHMLEHSEDVDLVMALYQTMPHASMKTEEVPGGLYKTLSDIGDDFIKLYEPYFFLSVAAKLYRRRIMTNGFITDKGPLMSDWLFNIRIMPSCRGIRFVPDVVYYYRMADHISTCSYFHSEWLYISKKVYENVIDLFPGNPQIEAYMARRYANRVGQHMISIALLHKAKRLQKLAMIQAERSDPFYQQTAIDLQ